MKIFKNPLVIILYVVTFAASYGIVLYRILDMITKNVFSGWILIAFIYASVSCIILGRITVKEEVKQMRNRCERRVNERFKELLVFIEMSKELANNNTDAIIKKYKDKLHIDNDYFLY